jgi:proteic killer suppression protein
MIKTFADVETEKIYLTAKSKKFSMDILSRAVRKLDRLDTVTSVDELKLPPSNRSHKLHGDRKSQWSISINLQWRICFDFSDGDAYNVEICDYH